MSWLEENDWAARLFRNAPGVVLTDADGVVSAGRGLVVPVKKETDQPGGKRHPLGTLTRPQVRFSGWLAAPGHAVGGTLSQGLQSWRVLDCRPVTLGARTLCWRCLLEREEAAP